MSFTGPWGSRARQPSIIPMAGPWDRSGTGKGSGKFSSETLLMLERGQIPGEVWHLPFTWPEEPKKVDWQPPEMSPLIKFYLEEIKQARKRAEEIG